MHTNLVDKIAFYIVVYHNKKEFLYGFFMLNVENQKPY